MITYDDQCIYKWGRPIAYLYTTGERKLINPRWLDKIDKERRYIYGDSYKYLLMTFVETSIVWEMVGSKQHLIDIIQIGDHWFYLNDKLGTESNVKEFSYIPAHYARLM